MTERDPINWFGLWTLKWWIVDKRRNHKQKCLRCSLRMINQLAKSGMFGDDQEMIEAWRKRAIAEHSRRKGVEK